MKKNVVVIILTAYFTFLSGLLVTPAFSAVKIKLLAVNPSVDKKQKMPVRFDFPPEVQKDDIVDPGGMEIDYDTSTNVYYAFKEIELPPKGTFTFQIIVTDKWTIPNDALDNLRDKLSEKLKVLENTDQYQTAKLLADKIQSRIDDITNSQNEGAAEVEKKIQLSRINHQTMNSLENDVLALEYLASRAVPVEEARTIKYFIEANNPTDKPLETRITHYLPKGVQAQYVVTNNDFEVKYDKDLDQLFLQRDDKFKPNENKRYEIEIKDLWYFTDKLLKSYKDQSEELNNDLSGTKFKNLASLIYNEITKDIEEIKTSQAQDRPLKDRIALYQINSEKEKRVKKNIDRLKTMLADSLKHTVIREVRPLAQLRLVEYLKKVAPKTEVYQVVLYILIFLILFTIVAAVIWISRMKKDDSSKYAKIEKPKAKEAEQLKDVNI